MITVAFGIKVLMLASRVSVGLPPIQFSARNQSEETAPVQSEVWACAETVVAATSAIVANNLEETNLTPVRAGDAVPLDDSRRGSHPISAPKSIGNS
jgi:hypothetical protein